jgi:hypothetical protein
MSLKHTANAATKVLTFPPWENWPSKVIWKIFLYLYFCHVWKDLKGGVKVLYRSLATDHAMLWFFIFIIFDLEHKWTRLMLCPLRNTFRKTHESSRKLIKMTSLKPGDGITLMRIFYLSGKILENVPENNFFIWTILFPLNKCMLTVIFDLQDVESMSTTSVTCGNINRPSCITTRYFMIKVTGDWSRDVMIFYFHNFWFRT